MYFVRLYNNDNQLIFNAPFDSRDAAIRYFNTKLDQKMFFENVPFMEYGRVEIVNDNVVLFDYEV